MNKDESLVDAVDAKIVFFSEIVKGKKNLDIGIVQHELENIDSPTWLHRALSLRAASILGLDIDKSGVEFLKGRGYNAIVADAQNFCLNEKFEVITAGDLIEHLDNPGGFLECVREHLGKDGVLAISTPNPFWWKTWLIVLLKGNSSPHPQHTCWYCEKTLEQLLGRHGFSIIKFEYQTVYNLTTFFQRLTRLINAVMPLPKRFRHNTMMVVAKAAQNTAK